MSFATLFLLAVAAIHFRLSSLQAFVLLAGYAGFSAFDRWYRRRKRAKVVEDELFGWKADKEESTWEAKSNMSRVRLTGENQIIAARVIQAMERLL